MKSFNELKEDVIELDEIFDSSTDSISNNFYKKIEELKNINLDDVFKKTETDYKKNTNEKEKAGKNKFNNLDEIKRKQKELKTLQNNLNRSKTHERSLVKNLQQEIYNEKDTKDYNELYMIITGIHIIVFILVIVSCIFTIINNVIITSITVFMYVLMMSIILIKFKKDEYRDTNDYNTFNIEKEKKSCHIKRKN